MEEISYVPEPEEEKKKHETKKTAKMNQKEMEKHLEEMYENKRQKIEEKQQQIREAKQERKDRKDQRATHKAQKLKSRKIGADPSIVDRAEDPENEEEQELFPDGDANEIKFHNPLAEMDDDDLYISEN